MPVVAGPLAIVAALIQVELLVALWLLVGGLPGARLIVAVGCFTVFAAASAYEAWHSAASCGCFGSLRVPPVATAIFDVCVAVALWLFGVRKRHLAESTPSRLRLIAGGAIGIAGSVILWRLYLLHFALVTGGIRGIIRAPDVIVLQPESWVNGQFSLADEIENSTPLGKDRWFVVFYHFDCGDCIQAIPNYMHLAFVDGTNAPRIAFVAMPPLAPRGEDPVPSSPAYLHLSLRRNHDWFATTPVVAALEDGKVVWAADGEAAVQPPVVLGWKR